MKRRCILLLLLAAAAHGEDVLISDAQERLASFSKGLKRRESGTEELVRLLDAALKAYGHVVADPIPPKKDGTPREDFELLVIEQKFVKARDKWEADLQDALLDAMVLKRLTGARKEKSNDRSVLNVRAAMALRRMPTGASKAIIRAFERHYMKVKDYTVEPAVLNAMFGTLVERDEPGSFRWLFDIITNDPRPYPRKLTESALLAIALFRAVPGRTRNSAVKKLIKTFDFTELQVRDDERSNASGTKIEAVELAARKNRRAYWNAVRPLVIDALNRLATDPIRKTRPGLYTVADFKTWYRRHGALGRSPWRDPD